MPLPETTVLLELSVYAIAFSIGEPPFRRGIDPDSALQACVTAQAAADSSRGDQTIARAAARGAERYYRLALEHDRDNARTKTLLARALSQCVIAHTPIFYKEGVINESIQLLNEVLARDSTNWEARYTLALNYYHAPEFFGWTDNAIREFERIVSQPTVRSTFTEQAAPFLFLGLLYERKGRRADARRVWSEGARLFPDDARLRARLSRDP